jgi:hydrogenase maturation protease
LTAKKTIIAGIGNRLMGDDGFGPRVTDLLTQIVLPDHIEVRDMGTAGITIASDLAEFTRAIFVDAMEMDGSPGEIWVSRLHVDSPTEYIIDLSRTTLHAAKLEGLLKFAKAVDTLPEEVYLVGCKPKSTEVGIELSREVEEATHLAVEKILELIKKG